MSRSGGAPRRGPVLVTGGGGFVGANLVRSLLSAGHEVRVLDDLSTGDRAHLAGTPVTLTEGRVEDEAAIRNATDGAWGVVHLAARTSVLESVADPWPTFETNGVATLRALEAASRAGVSRFVFASSNAVLGEQIPPVDEFRVPRPVSPYGASKLVGEAYCSAFFRSRGLETVVLRFSNVYGPYSGRKSSVVAKFIRALVADEPLPIYGDGQQTRDLIYVEDLTHGIVQALEAEDVGGELFHLATGRETTVLELAQVLREVTGKPAPAQWLPQPRGEIRRNYASIEKARRQLGFEPQWNLRSGLERTFSWLVEQPGRLHDHVSAGI